MSPAEFKVNPAGNDPDTRLKLIRACPPVVCSWVEYPCPTVPEGRAGGEVMLNAGQLTPTFVETEEGSEAETQPPDSGGGIACAVIVYKPALEYTWVILHGVVQEPRFVNDSVAANLICTPHGAAATGYDAVTVAVTFWPIAAGFGEALRVMAWVTLTVRRIKDMTESSATSSIWRFIIIPP
jgi:hypothetical protein